MYIILFSLWVCLLSRYYYFIFNIFKANLSNCLDFVCLRRGISGNVYDRWPKEVLCCHEENGEQKTSQSNSKTKGNCIQLGIISIIKYFCWWLPIDCCCQGNTQCSKICKKVQNIREITFTKNTLTGKCICTVWLKV